VAIATVGRGIEGGTMNVTGRLRWWFNIEAGLAVVAAALAVLTLISREWIELLTGWDPDNGNGAFERAIVVVLLVAALALGLGARAERRRLRSTPA
jgi:hypothetical protein